jgi:hypothetical protein
VNQYLFDIDTKKTKTIAKDTLIRVKCTGCPSTALVNATRGRGIYGPLPKDWIFCGEVGGELARWCGQCTYEGRHENR